MNASMEKSTAIDSGGFEVTRNPCTVCTPLGATIAFAGIERGMTVLHGSQGCATYIRRYAISHFREPLDVASSSFTEETAVFGGAGNLRLAVDNVIREYRPAVVGVATTCLAETIGEDAAVIRRVLAAAGGGPLIVPVSTPSYRGSHRDGFRAATRALAEATNPPAAAAAASVSVAVTAGGRPVVALFPALVSTADLRHLRAEIESFGLDAIFATDYSRTLDGGPWKAHRLLPEGGSSVADLVRMRMAAVALELGARLPPELSGAAYLAEAHGVAARFLSLPIGVRASDRWTAALREVSGNPLPMSLAEERERLLDSYADGHKYVFGKRALLYGDIDFVQAVADFLREIGMVPLIPEGEGRDFYAVERAASEASMRGAAVDLVIGNGKGYKTAEKLGVPLVRIGFPIHDRFGGQRIRVLGYGGTQVLFDRIVNALIERAQEDNHVGYTYY